MKRYGKMSYVPAIDAAAEMLNCLPGEVPARVEALLERERVRPASEPPDTYREVLVQNGNRVEFAIYDSGMWIGRIIHGRAVGYYDVRGWWELPGVEKEVRE